MVEAPHHPSGTCTDCRTAEERSWRWAAHVSGAGRRGPAGVRDIEPDEPRLGELVAHLQDQVPRLGCDHDLALTERWALREGLLPACVRDAVQSLGAWCDCEAMLDLGT